MLTMNTDLSCAQSRARAHESAPPTSIRARIARTGDFASAMQWKVVCIARLRAKHSAYTKVSSNYRDIILMVAGAHRPPPPPSHLILTMSTPVSLDFSLAIRRSVFHSIADK